MLDRLRDADGELLDRSGTVASLGDNLISANAYLRIEPIIAALQGGADVVIAGRVSDPALFLVPLVHEFGWALDDWGGSGRGRS